MRRQNMVSKASPMPANRHVASISTRHRRDSHDEGSSRRPHHNNHHHHLAPPPQETEVAGNTPVIREGSLNSEQRSFVRRRERDGTNETMEMLKANLVTRKQQEGGPEGRLMGKIKSFMKGMIAPMQGDNFPTNSWMIHPNSAFAACLFMFSGVLLLYSAVQTPVDIGFYWEQDICDVFRLPCSVPVSFP